MQVGLEKRRDHREPSAERGHASLQLVRELFGLDEEPQKDGSSTEADTDAKLAEVRSIKSARKS